MTADQSKDQREKGSALLQQAEGSLLAQDYTKAAQQFLMAAQLFSTIDAALSGYALGRVEFSRFALATSNDDYASSLRHLANARTHFEKHGHLSMAKLVAALECSQRANQLADDVIPAASELMSNAKALFDELRIQDARQDYACSLWLNRELVDFHWSMIFRLAEDGQFDEAAASVGKAQEAARALKALTGSRHHDVMIEIYPATFFLLQGEDSADSYEFEAAKKHLAESSGMLDRAIKDLSGLGDSDELKALTSIVDSLKLSAAALLKRVQAEESVIVGDINQARILAASSAEEFKKAKDAAGKASSLEFEMSLDLDHEASKVLRLLRSISKLDPGLDSLSEKIAKIVSRQDLREIAISDLKGISSSFIHKEWKSVLILVGGVLEGTLLDLLIHREPEALKSAKAPKDRNGRVLSIEKWRFSQIIVVAESLKILPAGLVSFSTALRNFRNIVHPLRLAKDKHTIGPDEAQAAISALQSVIRYISS